MARRYIALAQGISLARRCDTLEEIAEMATSVQDGITIRVQDRQDNSRWVLRTYPSSNTATIEQTEIPVAALDLTDDEERAMEGIVDHIFTEMGLGGRTPDQPRDTLWGRIASTDIPRMRKYIGELDRRHEAADHYGEEVARELSSHSGMCVEVLSAQKREGGTNRCVRQICDVHSIGELEALVATASHL